MGAPKLKWTSGEEAALKAGVAKYGMGKWSTILKDPDFAPILRSRSNVDLKDKWRNLHVMANGWGSRQRGKIVCKSTQSKHDDEESMALTTIAENDMDILDEKPLATVSGTCIDDSSKKPITSLDEVIMEAIAKLKEPRGSSRNVICTYIEVVSSCKLVNWQCLLNTITFAIFPAYLFYLHGLILLHALLVLLYGANDTMFYLNRNVICTYIEENYKASPNLERQLAANLKDLTERRRLIKVKHFYRIAPSGMSTDVKGEPSPPMVMGEKQVTLPSPKPESSNGIRILTKAQIDAELEKMRSMNAQEAAIAAAQAVAEAEAAIAEAERAALEAEEAEAEAEAAHCFAEAASKALNFQTTIHV
ncbi:unnamed protein product [Cuscuta campestris]|uniref:MYB transcription factor n=1 Tax=Cuscuta campestris TaxID=132261 RepID=A0A484LFM1_9ASTE|nr:unnamed protein product [Cuscuta campestris]